MSHNPADSPVHPEVKCWNWDVPSPFISPQGPPNTTERATLIPVELGRTQSGAHQAQGSVAH